MSSYVTIALCLPLSMSAHAAQSPEHPSLKDLLKRVSAYVQSYGEKASVLVAMERYVQTVDGSRQAGTAAHRTTVAEFAIVNTSGSQHWVGFRDVVEVDGEPLTDHRDRLLSILTDPSADVDQARRLSEESARFNIGPIFRNFNVPTTALFFFAPENLDRFKFKLQGTEADGDVRIAFRETYRPTLIRSPNGTPVPTEGELFAGRDGVVHRTILRAHSQSEATGTAVQIEFTVDVEYARVESVEMWLPSIMTEEYIAIGRPASTRVNTRAEYSNYRRFETSVRIK